MIFKNISKNYSQIDYNIDLKKLNENKPIIGKIDIKFNQDRNIYNPFTYMNTLVASNCGWKNKILEMKGIEIDMKNNKEIKVWDFLDPQNGYEVDEKYYLSDEKIIMISKWGGFEDPLKKIIDQKTEIMGAFTTRSGDMTNSIKLIKNIFKSNHHGGKVYDEEQGALPVLKHNKNNALHIRSKARIRKITPREAYRLMGVRDKKIDNVFYGDILGDAHHYKLAGNSIVVDCLVGIFERLDLPKEVKLLELFSGYGAQRLALERLGHKVQSNISEWFKSALIAYSLLHHYEDFTSLYEKVSEKEVNDFWEKNKKVFSTNSSKPSALNLKGNSLITKKALYVSEKLNNNLGSVLDIKKLTKRYDLVTWSFPCQDISNAGKGAGFDDNTTRSGLCWEAIRLLKKAKEDNLLPKYLLMENVYALINKRNLKNFEKLQEILNEIGYDNVWIVLNAKDFGIPQNRERVFMVSTLKKEKENE